MKDYKKKTEELLLDFTKKEEINNKRAFMNMWVLLISTFLFYTMLIMLACMTLSEGPLLGTIICVSTVLVVIVAFYALKVEVYTGYYECNKCHHRHVPSYWKALIAPHMATTRFLRCPKCHKFSWSKKVMSKEEKINL